MKAARRAFAEALAEALDDYRQTWRWLCNPRSRAPGGAFNITFVWLAVFLLFLWLKVIVL